MQPKNSARAKHHATDPFATRMPQNLYMYSWILKTTFKDLYIVNLDNCNYHDVKHASTISLSKS